MDYANSLNLQGELGTGSSPVGDAGKAERQAPREQANLDAGLRQRGAGGVTIRIIDLSTHGFRASTHLELTPGTEVWLKLPGLESWPSKVVWMDGFLIGCQFARPLHPAVLANILRSAS